jgi:protein N-lysine methyltransferase METTL21A
MSRSSIGTLSSSFISHKRIFILSFCRGEPIPSDIPSKPDVILAADCVYFEPAFPLLVQTLCDLSDKDTKILFCYKKRRKADKRFFGMLKKKFSWKEV